MLLKRSPGPITTSIGSSQMIMVHQVLHGFRPFMNASGWARSGVGFDPIRGKDPHSATGGPLVEWPVRTQMAFGPAQIRARPFPLL
jgi:hypothetical protein